jgi:hypothetical protein
MLGNFKEILLSDVEIIDGGNSNYLNGDIVNYQQILKVNKSLKVKNQKTASFKKIFEIKKGLAKYTKGFVQKNRGEYPLYSSQTINEGIIGKINCYDYDCECLTWATDGDAGAVFIRKGKFSMTTHCGALVLKSKLLLLEYIYSYLSENLKKYAVGGGKNRRITIDVIKNVKIKVPIALQGEFDLQKQREIAEKDKRVRELKNKVKLYKQKIDELVIEKSPDNSDNNFKEIAIDEIFDLATSRANSSKFTKSFIEKHKGDIPVYGASGNESVVGYGYVQDNLSGIKYFEDCLTWNIDGSIGKLFFREGRFSLSEKVIPLIVKSAYKNCLDKINLKYAIENKLATQNFGFTNKAGKSKIKNVKIKIPITSSGEFGIEKQRKVAEEYQKIEEIRKNIRTQLEKIENTKVDIGISE